MQNAVLYLHSLLRWVVLILLILSIVNSFAGWQRKKIFTAADGKLWLFTMISAHLTLLLGLYLLFFGRFGIITPGLPPGTDLMADKFYRFYWIEHPVGMILSIVFITLGRGMAKKAVADQLKYRRAFWYFLIALILILATVPWPFREIVGRPWLPGIQ